MPTACQSGQLRMRADRVSRARPTRCAGTAAQEGWPLNGITRQRASAQGATPAQLRRAPPDQTRATKRGMPDN
eukprot:5779705-Lingulodinium_polyedra.AAC.1